MKNSIKFLFSSLLIIVMSILSIIFYINNHQILIAGITSIAFTILFFINTFIFIKYINFEKYGEKKYINLINNFIKRWFKMIDSLLLASIIISSIIAICEFYFIINLHNENNLYLFINVLILPLIITIIYGIIKMLNEYSEIKLFFKKA